MVSFRSFPRSDRVLTRHVTAEQRAIVNNKTKVTKAQIVEFLNLCWTKYSRAKVEPGMSLPLRILDRR